MIFTRTPYRISFFGGGTDYPEWFREHGGRVLGATIDKYCWVGARPRSPFGPRYKISYSKTENCDSLDEIQHPAARECLRYLGIEGAEIYTWSDLPSRSGIGSSSAFVVGLLHALLLMRRAVPSKQGLASMATVVERDILKESVGCQDQVLTAWGGVNTVRFFADRGLDRVEIKLLMGRDYRLGHSDNLERNLMLYYTGISRISSDVTGTYIGGLAGKPNVLNRLMQMVDEGVYTIFFKEMADFGILLDEAWRLKKSLGSAITTPEIDGIYETAEVAGAVGGKLLGGGGGGFMVFCVHPEEQESVREALAGRSGVRPIEVPFKFEFGGSRVMEFKP